MISMIVAMAKNRAIGKDNQLLWHLPADLQYFKRITMGKPILMGRKTYQSIGRPLPGRVNIVVSRDKTFAPEGVVVVRSIEQALKAASEHDDVMIIGGSSFYEQMLPMTDMLYVTQVHQPFEADAFFPELNSQDWEKIAEEYNEPDEKNKLSYSFQTFKRVKN
jgi:dihydrofolate reductase